MFVLVVATMDQVPDDLSSWKEAYPWINIILPFRPELMVFGDPLRPLYNVLKVSMLAVYLIADHFYLSKERWQRALISIKLVVISLIVLLTVIVPTVNWIAARHNFGPSKYANDGMIETEEAVKALLRGENPYSITYENTPVAGAVKPALWQRYGIPGNPIFYHFPYPPLTFLSALPLYKICDAAIGWYDHRFLLLPMFVLGLVLAYRIADDTEARLALVGVLALNPFCITELRHGLNDVMLLFFILWTVHLLKLKRTVVAAAVLALACGSKQMAWVMVPFFFTYIYAEKERSGIKGLLFSRELAVFAAISAAIFLPFLIWDGSGLIEDILSFHSGKTAHPYPLRGDAGYGFANLVLHFGLVDSVRAYFPFTLFEIVFALPLLGWLLFRQIRENSLKRMLSGYTLVLFVFLFFGRYMAGNYIGFILSLLAVSYFMGEPEKTETVTCSSPS